ncbi:MAG: M28 family peptidase [Bacteroidota bacterium]
MKKINQLICLVVATLFFVACSNDSATKQNVEENILTEEKKVLVATPQFNADSAYAFIKKQVDFGPRVPGTKNHQQCADYLTAKLKNYGAEVMVQNGKVNTYDKKTFDLKNIIASFNPNQPNRILLCAHWDTRHIADRDNSKKEQPIDGANDGASGVGVLLEIARLLQEQKSTLGIDIILFDLEDYGEPRESDAGMEDSWCLGSQYWAKNKHKANYSAQYGILLDMVGAKDATFLMETSSDYYASWVNKKMWDNAIRLGYSNYFVYDKFGPITDDHLYINQFAKIPTIDIIQWDKNRSDFGSYHHTHKDNMSVIDKNTLKAVGQSVVETIYGN